MLTFAYVPCASQFPFGGDVSIILPMRSSAGTLLGGAKLGWESALKPVPCSIAPGSLRERRSNARGIFWGLGLLRARVHVAQPMPL